MVYRLTGFIDRFHLRHPKLRVEFVTSDRYLDLLKGEADVAFRSGDTDDELVGRKVADPIWAVYTSRGYVERHGKPGLSAICHGIVWSALMTLGKHRVMTWLNDVAPNATISARNNSVLGLVYAVKSGVGIGALPTAIADAEPDLIRVLGPIPELARSWRLLTHPDLRRTPRTIRILRFRHRGARDAEIDPVQVDSAKPGAWPACGQIERVFEENRRGIGRSGRI